MPMNPRLLRPKALGVPVFSEQGYTRLWAVTNKSGAVTGSASTDSGKYAVKWWDGTTDVYDSGDPFTKSGSGTRAFEIFPCDAGGAPSGQFDGFDVSDNSLVQLRAEDVALNSSAPSGGYNTGTYPYYNWIPYVPGSTEQGDLSENELSAVALDQFYTDLDSGTGDLIVTGNPGIVDDDPTIATGKGYTVFGSVPPSTTLLLNFNGSNGATSTTDGSPEGHAITFNGDAEISTAQSKFGGSSVSMSNSGSGHLTIGSDPSLDFGTGDFTVEGWYYITSLANDAQLFGDGVNCGCWSISLQSTGVYIAVGCSGADLQITTWTPPLNQWFHLAATRASGTMRFFADGTEIGSQANNTSNYVTTANFGIGMPSGTYTIDGYIDDVRIIKGHALYTANFTPPTAELGVWYP